MGRKSKIELEEEARGKYKTIILDALPNAFTGESISQEDFFNDLGIPICEQCQNVILDENPSQCDVCDGYFCADCRDEHAYEETGL